MLVYVCRTLYSSARAHDNTQIHLRVSENCFPDHFRGVVELGEVLETWVAHISLMPSMRTYPKGLACPHILDTTWVKLQGRALVMQQSSLSIERESHLKIMRIGPGEPR